MDSRDVPVICVDGPSGSGKGTISARLAARLNWHWLDSGALYRGTALYALTQGIALDDVAALTAAAARLPLHFQPEGDATRIVLDGEDVTQSLRTESCATAASKVAALLPVREALLQRQRDYATPPGLVADGRDMGTVIFPDAELKLFITASVAERARRRARQLRQTGENVIMASLVWEISARDARDSNRQVAPLKPADDAIVIDTSDVAIDAVMDQVNVLVDQRF